MKIAIKEYTNPGRMLDTTPIMWAGIYNDGTLYYEFVKWHIFVEMVKNGNVYYESDKYSNYYFSKIDDRLLRIELIQAIQKHKIGTMNTVEAIRENERVNQIIKSKLKELIKYEIPIQ